MSARLPILVLVVAVAMATAASATTIVVDWTGGGDYTLIQDGINAASEGDTVLVMPGTYEGPGNTYIGFGGTNLVLMSSGGAGSTFIDCEGMTMGFSFCGFETAACVVEGFTIANGASTRGAGMRFTYSSPTIRDCVFNRNIANDYGGGIYCTSGASPTLDGCTFSNNQANRGASAACDSSATPSFTSCTFLDNVAAWNAGGVWMNLSSPSFTGCSFERNSVTAAFSDGGAVLIRTYSSPTFLDCSFADNTAPESGGGLEIFDNCSPSFAACTFAYNSANYGGGVAMDDAVNATFDNCWFYENTAMYDGGAAHCSAGSVPLFTDCKVAGNSAGDAGGAMYFCDYTTPVVTGCTLYGNSAPSGSGVWCDDNFTLTNCIIAFGLLGEAVYCDGDPPEPACTDIYGNAGGDWIGCLSGLDLVDDNIHADPLFCDAPSGDLGIDVASPCAPANAPACGLIGAGGVSCDSPVRAESWGAIKAMYR